MNRPGLLEREGIDDRRPWVSGIDAERRRPDSGHGRRKTDRHCVAPHPTATAQRYHQAAHTADVNQTSTRRRPRSAPWRLPFIEAPLRLTALRREARIRATLACADLLAGACALVAIGSAYGSGSFVAPESVLILPIVIVLARVLGLYHKDEIRLRQSTLDEAPALFQLATLFALAVWLARHAIFGGDFTGAHVMSFLLGFFAVAFSFRVVARAIGRRITAPERCLVVGYARTVERFERALGATASGSVIVRSMPSDTASSEQESFLTLSDPTRLAAILETDPADRLIVAPRDPATDHVLALVHAAKLLGLRVTVLPFLDEVMGASAEIETVGGMTVLDLPRYDLSRSARATKRALDVLGAAFGLVALLPVLTVVAVLIKLESHGPVLFRQTRTGRDGKKFSILKFRTMVEGADKQKGQLQSRNESAGLFKIADDPRITRVGRPLRMTSLDELPQLWNVARGDMSLVGPRPLVEDEDAKVVGWFRHRLRLQPGMTGHWQVLGSSRIPLDDMIRIDYLYVANWSLWGDIKLLLRTVPYVLARRGL